MSASEVDTSWCQSFSWMKERDFTPIKTQTVFADDRCWCRLCQQTITLSLNSRLRHAKKHLVEFKLWNRNKDETAKRESAKKNKELAKLKKEGKIVEERTKSLAVKTPKEQGFPEVYLAETGKFKPGYDAKAKSDLVASALGLSKPDKLHRFTKEKAQELISLRGWDGYLERKRKIMASK